MTEFIQIVIGGVLQGSIYAIIAVGFSLVYRVTGVINLSQGAFCVLGAMMMYSLEVTLGWPAAAAGVAAAAGTAIFSAILGATTFMQALGRLSNSSILMLSVGILTLIEGLILVTWGSEPYALPPFNGEHPVRVFSIRIASQGLWIGGTTISIILLLWYTLTFTEFGRALKACAENRTAAQLMGIRVRRMTLISFTMAATIAAIGGIVVAPITSLEFDTGRLFSIYGFIAVAVGGLGTIGGAIAGGIFLGVVDQLAVAYISSLFAKALSLGLLLSVLLLRPQGLFTHRVAPRRDLRDDQRIFGLVARYTRGQARVLSIIGIVALFSLPLFVPEGGVLNSLVISGIIFIAVLGLDVLMGYGGQVSLGQAAFMAIGGYTSAILATRYEFSPLFATSLGILASLICALILAAVTLRLRGLYLALATLAFGLLVDSLAVGLTELTGGPSGLVGIPPFSIGGISFETPISMYYLVTTLIVVSIILLKGCMESSFGRALQAIRTDPIAAAALGINVLRYKIAAVAISAILASVSGSLYAYYFRFLSPEMVGTQRSLEMLTMLVVGGEGTLIGPLIGVSLLTLLPTVFQPLALYKTLTSGALLIIFFLYLPQGLYGAFANTVIRIWPVLGKALQKFHVWRSKKGEGPYGSRRPYSR